MKEGLMTMVKVSNQQFVASKAKTTLLKAQATLGTFASNEKKKE